MNLRGIKHLVSTGSTKNQENPKLNLKKRQPRLLFLSLKNTWKKDNLERSWGDSLVDSVYYLLSSEHEFRFLSTHAWSVCPVSSLTQNWDVGSVKERSLTTYCASKWPRIALAIFIIQSFRAFTQFQISLNHYSRIPISTYEISS